NDCKNEEITKIIFNINQADIANVYSEIEGNEENEQLVETWKMICRHINGLISFIVKDRDWQSNGVSIEVVLLPDGIFSPNNASLNISNGFVNAANSNKTINKIDFETKCYRKDDNCVANLNHKFVWEFSDTSSWIHNFADICKQEREQSYIPIASMKNLKTLIFAKSEEEFFDLYDESDLAFDFNLVEYLKKKDNPNAENFVMQFIKLGDSFSKFIKAINNEGFYECLVKGTESEAIKLVDEYNETGELIIHKGISENLRWILDAFIHAFNIEISNSIITKNEDSRCCIVPPWHPATLQKILDQKIFFLDGCIEWWKKQDSKNEQDLKEENVGLDSLINKLTHMSLIQSSLDLFPSSGQQYFGSTASFGAFSIYARDDIENNNRLKDIINKDAIYDDDFDAKEIAKMNDNAKMIYSVIEDYIKAFSLDHNLSLVFINPMDLQPIVASIYEYIKEIRKNDSNEEINIILKILVKSENKGGRNYLSYWMDEFFPQDANVNIRTYFNEWNSVDDLDRFLNGNNDIVFLMDLLKVDSFTFTKDISQIKYGPSDCRFPIIYKPIPISQTSVKRRVELSQPQFSASYKHTQIVHYRNHTEDVPDKNYIAVREIDIDKNIQDIVYLLHSKAYWVVCIDSGMDGAVLKNDEEHKDEYSIIGFSTGKGVYGQYNLTVTTRSSILDSIRQKVANRLKRLFKWEQELIEKVTSVCIKEAGKLDGISLFSAINPKDHNMNEFMAYVLTSLREKKYSDKSALKIMIHLDSYKHWFRNDIEKDEYDSGSRPDFLLLDVVNDNYEKLNLNATVIECKIAHDSTSQEHKEKALKQVIHGIKRLSTIFSPDSNSIERRYWYAQLYRALTFAQVTFNDNTSEFELIIPKLRKILNGDFEITWSGKVIGYWADKNDEEEIKNVINDEQTGDILIELDDIPQIAIQKLFTDNDSEVNFVDISEDDLMSEAEETKKIKQREDELNFEIKSLQNLNKLSSYKNEPLQVSNNRNNDNTETCLLTENNNINKNELINQQDENINNEDIRQKLSEIKINNNILGDERVLIGKDKFGSDVYWEFGHSGLANRHMLITGTSGQGKTYCIQTMLYELLKNKVSAMAFDYTEGFRRDQLEKSFLEKMGDKVNEYSVYFNGVPINPFKRHEVEEAGRVGLEKIADAAGRIANILRHVYELGDQQYSAVFQAARKGMEKYGEQMNMYHFRKMLEEEKKDNKTAQSVISKMDPFFYSVDFNISNEFDWKDILYPEDSKFTIFQLTRINKENQIIITELMLWDAYYYAKKYGSKNKAFVTILDEAQNLSHKDDSPSAAILTEGRKFGWSAWFATQSLDVLADDEIVRLLQSSNKLYFKPTDKEILKMSKQLDLSNSSKWSDVFKKLKKGECIVVGDRIGQNGIFAPTRPTVTTVTSFEERN
ncbi:MAG: DUF87 domain-containing protein, partial [Pseudomonadota bacterium]|nr:DUF87 domain-containing protein [Pseudomonadota bacterium]